MQLHLLHSADVIKLFTATTKAEIKFIILTMDSRYGCIPEQALLIVEALKLKTPQLTYLFLVPKIMYFFSLNK